MNTLDRGKILTEALPYIQRYNGKTVVINCGGSMMDSKELRGAVASDVMMLRLVGIQVVLVHGMGVEVLSAVEQSGVPVTYENGQPCLTEAVVEKLQQLLCGTVNKNMVGTLNQTGGKAIGLCGVDGSMLTVKGEQLGKVDVTILQDAMAQGYTPVVAAVAQNADNGDICCVDADIVASKLAVALKAEKLIQLVSCEDLIRDPAAPESPIPVLELSRVPALIRSGVIPAKLVTKANVSVEAVRSGVKSVTLLDGSVPHAILLELLSDEGIGTMLTH